MLTRFPLLWLLLLLFAPSTKAESVSTGSAYLRTLTTSEPPFGRRLADVYPYEGVRIQRYRRDQLPVDWLMVSIDLQTPGLGFRVTPIHYRPGPAGTPFQSADAQHTLDFLKENNTAPRVDLAVNTVAYWPFPSYQGSTTFLSEPVWTSDDSQRDPSPGSWMLGLAHGRAVLSEPQAVRDARPQVAFGGFHEGEAVPFGLAVRDGKPCLTGGSEHARTLAGVTVDGRVLLLLVADGYNPGVSIGLSQGDAAQLMVAAGAHHAIFFDGGGSSTLVGRTATGDGLVLNRPAGQQNTPGTLRHVAVNLGFTNLRRSADPLPAVPDWQASCPVVVWHNLITWSRVEPLGALLVGLLGLLGAGLLGWLCRRRPMDPHPHE